MRLLPFSAGMMICRRRLKRRARLWVPFSIGAALILAMFIAVYGAPDALEAELEEQMLNLYGEADAIAMNSNYDLSKDPGVYRLGLFTAFGRIPLDENGQREPIVLGTADSGAIELCRIKLLNGRFPAGEGEIAVESWAAKELGLELNGEAELTYYVFDGEAYNKKVISGFRVVGIMENYSRARANRRDYGSPKPVTQQLPAILCGGRLSHPSVNHIAFEVSDSPSTWIQVNDIGTNTFKAGESGLYINSYKTSELYEQNMNLDALRTLRFFFGVTALLLWLLLMYIYVMDSRRGNALLQRIGVNRVQRVGIIFVQTAVITLCAAAVGGLLSVILNDIIEGIIKTRFNFTYSVATDFNSIFTPVLIFIAGGLLLGLLLSWLACAGGGARKKRGIRSQSRSMSLNMLLLKKEILLNLPRFVAISLAIMACLSLTNEAADQLSRARSTSRVYCDIQLTQDTLLSKGYLHTPVDLNRGISQTQMNSLAESRYVSDSLAVKRDYINIILDDNSGVYLQELLKYSNILDNMNIKDHPDSETMYNDYIGELEGYGYDPDDRIYHDEIYEIPLLTLEQGGLKIYGQTDAEKLTSGETMAIIVREDAYEEEMLNLLGEKIHFTRIVNGPDDDSSKAYRVDFTSEVSAIVVFKRTNGLFESAFSEYPRFALFEGALAKNRIPMLYNGIYLNLYDPKDEILLENELEAALMAAKDMELTSNTSISEKEREIENFTFIANASVIIPLMGASFVIIIITHIYKLNERRDIYKRLHVMGVSRRRLNFMMLTDYAAYILCAYILYGISILLRFATDDDNITRQLASIALQNCFVLAAFGAIAGGLSIYHYRFLKRLD